MIPMLYSVSNGAYTRLPGADVHVKNVVLYRNIDGGGLEMGDANAHGWIVGRDAANVPTLYTPSAGLVRLPTVTTPTKYSAVEDLWINDSGTTLGGYSGPDGPVMWTCR